jgi:diguanylate cyclase (GGDEF)-like protein/PAS domain S-box-containing protein
MPRSGDTSTRLRVVAVALVAMVVMVAGLTFESVRITADRGKSVTDLQDLRAEMYALSSLEWQAQALGGLFGEIEVQAQTRPRAFRALVGRIEQSRGDEANVARVLGRAHAYLAALDEEFRLLEDGDLEQADLADVRRVDPAFEGLDHALNRAIRTANRSAQRWLRAASLVVAALIPLVALAALWWLRRESRRETAIGVERAARTSARRFESMVRGASDLVLVTRQDGEVTYASPAARRMLGCDPADLLDSGLDRRVHVADVSALREAVDTVAAAREGELTAEFRAMHTDGAWRTLECRLHNATQDDGVSGVVWNVRDVTERRALEGQLTHQAFHDVLTGLANRALLTDRLGQALARASRAGAGVGVVVLDLDGFKDVNDSLGHEAGDEVIVVAAGRLKQAVRQGDTVARFGGDEFVLLLEELSSTDSALAIADRAVELLAEPTRAHGREVALTASAGVAVIFGAALEEIDAVEALVRDADVAMYAAKQRGKGQAVVFENSMRALVQDRLDLIVDIRSAAANGEIRVLYQPLVDLARQTVVGFEALARWHHPTRGMISPVSFIPLAEETGAILDIGRHVLRAACIQVAWWNGTSPGAPPLEVSVNISARQLASRGLVADVERVIADTGLQPSLLVLEITESAVVEDVVAASNRLRELRALGVRIAMDDFGTGYSSLSYLRRLPIDILKIDKSFLGDSAGRGSELLASVAALGATLGLTTVAEGIEEPEQLAQVRAAGCTMGQGYHFARPLAPEAAGRFTRDQGERFAEPPTETSADPFAQVASGAASGG